MSDRIDELVSNIEDGLHGKCGFTLSESSLNNLVTIARESNERALKAEAEADKWRDRYAALVRSLCVGCNSLPPTTTPRG